jgi:plastocyanin
MARKRLFLLAIVAVAAVGIAACEQQEPDITTEDQVGAEQRPDEAENDDVEENGEAADGDVFTFVAIDLDFEEFPEEIPAGEVTFELVNDGNLEHNVTVDDLGDEMVVEAMGGETATGTVELEPGTYSFHCDVPGHEQQMQGEFTVQ